MVERARGAAPLLGAIALSLFSAACASTGTAPKPFPMPEPGGVGRATPPAPVPTTPEPAEPTGAPGTTSDLVVRAAMDLRGAPYRDGGSDPRGFDCSGFTQYVFAQAGTLLPRETREQYLVGMPVPVGEQQPGDLIFFTTTAPGASHVGIALGGDAFVHAPSSRGFVRVEQLTLPYWSRRLVGIRRIAIN
jgi:cell wall-associated NlpC family hydrolase